MVAAFAYPFQLISRGRHAHTAAETEIVTNRGIEQGLWFVGSYDTLRSRGKERPCSDSRGACPCQGVCHENYSSADPECRPALPGAAGACPDRPATGGEGGPQAV